MLPEGECFRQHTQYPVERHAGRGCQVEDNCYSLNPTNTIAWNVLIYKTPPLVPVVWCSVSVEVIGPRLPSSICRQKLSINCSYKTILFELNFSELILADLTHCQ